MNVLKKILEEIKEIEKEFVVGHEVLFALGATGMAAEIEEIIRSHMNNSDHNGELNEKVGKDTNAPTKAEEQRWISVSEQLPEPLDLVMVTVHTSEWIADYDSAWVPDGEKTYHPEEYNTRIAYKIPEGNWIFYDETGSEVCCEEEIGTKKGVCYDVVTAWQPLPEPYKGV